MIAPTVSYRYSQEKSSQSYKLAIRVLEDACLLAILNSNAADIVGFAKTESHRLEKHPFLKNKYQRIIIELNSPFYHLIPDEYYQKDLMLSLPNRSEDQMAAITKNNIVVAYRIAPEMKVILNKIKGNLQITHSAATNINHALKQSYPASRVFLQYFGDYFNLLLVEQDRVKLANSFQIRSIEEGLFYVISVYEKWQLDHKNTAILVDEVLDATEFLEELKKYIGVVASLNLPNNFSYSVNSKKTENIPRQFSGLLNLFSS